MRFHFFILASSLLLWHAYALPLRPHAVHDPPVHNTPLSQKNIDPPSAVLQRCNGALSETSILGTSTLNQNSDGPKSNIDFPRVPSSDAAIQPHTANRVGIRRALSKTAQKKQANAERRKENRKAAKADVKQRIAAMPAMPGEQQARKSLQNAKKGAFDRKKGVYSSSNSNKAKKAVGKAQAAVAPFDAARKQKALSDRKKQQSQRTIDLKAAAAEYGKITNKPQRNSKFKVKGDTTSSEFFMENRILQRLNFRKDKPERVASGKDVRAAIFASQYKPATEKVGKHFLNSLMGSVSLPESVKAIQECSTREK